jgi:hypothetical protein
MAAVIRPPSGRYLKETPMEFTPEVRRAMLLAETVRMSALVLNAAVRAAVDAGLFVAVKVDGMEPEGEENGRVPSVAVTVDRA